MCFVSVSKGVCDLSGHWSRSYDYVMTPPLQLHGDSSPSVHKWFKTAMMGTLRESCSFSRIIGTLIVFLVGSSGGFSKLVGRANCHLSGYIQYSQKIVTMNGYY